jgi:hypothetical protein
MLLLSFQSEWLCRRSFGKERKKPHGIYYYIVKKNIHQAECAE